MNKLLETKIIRLNTGEDIIASCMMSEDNALVTVGNPMRIVVRRFSGQGQAMLVMTPWLPLELIEEDLATLNYTDIVTIVSPKQSFVDYYLDTVQQYREMMEEKENGTDYEFSDEDEDYEGDDEEGLTDDFLQEMLELNKEKKNNTIH